MSNLLNSGFYSDDNALKDISSGHCDSVQHIDNRAISFKYKTYYGIEEYRLPCDKIGQLEKNVMNHFDKKIADLVYLFLNEECTSEGIDTISKLFEYEMSCNTSSGKLIYDYSATLETGAQLTIDYIKNRFNYIWKDYLFIESTDLHFDALQFYYHLEKTEDPLELLFWSFRLCAWGNYDNKLPYTLYKCIVDERFKRFYNSCPEWQNTFLYIDSSSETSEE